MIRPGDLIRLNAYGTGVMSTSRHLTVLPVAMPTAIDEWCDWTVNLSDVCLVLATINNRSWNLVCVLTKDGFGWITDKNLERL